MIKGGAGLPTKLGWRVYIKGIDFYFYAYTAVGFAGENAAVDAVLEHMGMRHLTVRAVVAVIEESSLRLPPESSPAQS